MFRWGQAHASQASLAAKAGRFSPSMCSTVHPRCEGRHSAVATATSLPATLCPPEWILMLPSSSQGILGGLTDGESSAALILPSYQDAASCTEPFESIMAENRLREKREV